MLVGYKLSKETRRRMSESATGRKHSEETKKKLSEINKKENLSPETILKRQEAHRGKKLSTEHKLAIGAAQFGSQKLRKNTKNGGRGYSCSDQENQTRTEARQRGNKYYQFPAPCPNGHLAERRVKSGMCRSCEAERGLTRYKNRVLTEPGFIAFNMARVRAHKLGLPFSITRQDVAALYPDDGLCPVLGLPLKSNIGNRGSLPNSPTLDRTIPSLGYVRGNIAIISHKANSIKDNETNPEIFKKLAHWLKYRGEYPADNRGANIEAAKEKVRTAKIRAKKVGVPFSLTVDDVLGVWPPDNLCPIFGTQFEQGQGNALPVSPTLDKINPSLGYVKGNIAIISYRANRMKQDEYNPDIFLKIATWLENTLREN